MNRQEILEGAKPILFNTEMVRAILDGRKTVMRRVMKPQPWEIGDEENECRHEEGFFDKGGNNWICLKCLSGVTTLRGGSYFHAPYQLGDILYVRETWSEWVGGYLYKAWPESIAQPGAFPGERWRPSIHMPKEAARIFLRVTDVRVERLQEITEEQAEKEGMPDSLSYPINPIYCPICHGNGIVGGYNPESLGFEDKECPDCNTLVKRFRNLWNSTIKKSDIDRYGWDTNPWVWAIEFERVEVE